MAEEDRELTFREHLEELRKRLIWAVAGLAITFAVSFLYVTKDLVDFLKADVPENTGFIFTGMAEGWTSYLRVAMFCAVGLALPFLVYQAVMFVRPALTRRERMYTYLMLPAVVVLFIAGVLFTYQVFWPNALQFLVNSDYLGTTMGQPMLSIGQYISDVSKVLFGMGIMFETPLIMFILTKLGVVTPGWLIRKWRYAIVLCVAAAAVITPTWDPINCAIVAGPLVLLYFLGILLSWVAGGSKKKEESPSTA